MMRFKPLNYKKILFIVAKEAVIGMVPVVPVTEPKGQLKDNYRRWNEPLDRSRVKKSCRHPAL